MVWRGCSAFKGIHAFFATLEAKSYKIQNRVMISRYRGRTICHVCEGTRLGKDTQNVFVGEKTLPELLLMPITEVRDFFEKLSLNDHDAAIGERLIWEV